VPGDRRAARCEALRGLLQDEGLDGLIVMHLPNIRYLTGFSGTAAIVAVLPHELIFLSDFRYRIQAEDEVGDLARVEIETSDLWKRLWQVLGEYSGMQAMGFEGHCATVSDVQRFSDAGLRMRVQPASQLVERLRAQKDPGEVAAIREAARLALEALEASLRCIRVGEARCHTPAPASARSGREIGSSLTLGHKLMDTARISRAPSLWAGRPTNASALCTNWSARRSSPRGNRYEPA
jgi:Xaa-Pro aminopeptidase